MERIGVSKARTHLPRLLDRVARGESLTITRHGRPVARLVPVPGGREQRREAFQRITERRRHVGRAPLSELMATVHEGHRY